MVGRGRGGVNAFVYFLHYYFDRLLKSNMSIIVQQI